MYRGEQRLSTKRAGEAVGRRLNPVNVILQTMHDGGYLIFTACSVSILYSLLSIVDCRLSIVDCRFYILYCILPQFSILSLSSLGALLFCSRLPCVHRSPDGITAEEPPTVVNRGGFFSAIHIDTVTVLCDCSVRLTTATCPPPPWRNVMLFSAHHLSPPL